MIIKKIGLPSILPDNDAQYIFHLCRLLEGVDKDCIVHINKTRMDIYDVSVAPSDNKLRGVIRQELEELHKLLALDIVFTSHKDYRIIKFSLK